MAFILTILPFFENTKTPLFLFFCATNFLKAKSSPLRIFSRSSILLIFELFIIVRSYFKPIFFFKDSNFFIHISFGNKLHKSFRIINNQPIICLRSKYSQILNAFYISSSYHYFGNIMSTFLNSCFYSFDSQFYIIKPKNNNVTL